MSDFSNYSDKLFLSESESKDNLLEEFDISDDLDEGIQIYADSLKSKNGITWSLTKPVSSKLISANIMSSNPGPTTFAILQIKNIIDCFLIFFKVEILNIIIFYTNMFGKNYFKNEWYDINETELKAYIGLLILMGIHKDRQEPLCELFSLSEGKEIHRRLFTIRRFKQISRSIHFDDFNTREKRKKDDKFCPICDLWNQWVDILHKCFAPYQDVTIDEQLVSFRGRCPFRQYMPMKPAKYGIKFFMLVDPVSNYVYNIEIYLGKNNMSNIRNRNIRENVVLSLSSPLYYSGRNIVADNFFTSFSLASKLLEKNLTFLGTIRKNKPEIPSCLLPSSKRQIFSSKFVFYNHFMMVSYVCKKSKAVIMLASGITKNSVCDETKNYKPDIILNYNATKGGVDNIDRMLASVSARRFTRRWPMIVFYNMLDLLLINAFSLYKSIFNDNKKSRRQFLKEIAKIL